MYPLNPFPGKRALLLTVDYEVFGNGTGDVREHITEPTERMARICEKHGAPLTVYFEVEEYLAFVREREALTAELRYDPAGEIRAQIIDLARRGHDIQLHLHPEWYGTKRIDGRWLLRPEKSSVDSLFGSVAEASAYIRERKSVIDELLAEAGTTDRVTAYRAGAFCAQPGSKLLAALAENGFVLDSSLVKGLYRRDAYATLDFSPAPAALRHWQVRSDVAHQEIAGPITEVPIYSRMGRRYQQLTPRRLLAKFSRHVPKEKQRQMVDQLKMGRTPSSLARFLLQRFPIKLDFHNMSARQMLHWVRTAPPAPGDDLDVLVLIGHTKEHRDDVQLDRFLAAVARDPAFEVISMAELSRRLLAHRAAVPASAA